MVSLKQISQIQNKISAGTFIIVEGKKDKKVLEKLRFKNILPLSGKSIDGLLRILKNKKVKRVIVLTDFDKEGEKKHKELCKRLEKSDIKIDFQIRNEFKQTFNVNKIEELSFIAKFMDAYRRGRAPSTANKIFNRNKFFRRRNYKKARRKKKK